MVGIQKKDILSIDGLIAPERIKAGDDGVYIFDKINMDEVRLYKFDSDFKNHELIMEIDGDLCTYGRDGYIYIACIDENTGVEVYDMDGKKIRELEIPGVVYSIDVDDNGCLYAVSAEDRAMNVSVYNKEGKFINTLHSRNMPILSSLWCQEDSMYLGGVMSKSMLRIEKVNWMSYIEDSFDINAPGTNYMVSKIIKSGSRIIAVLSGDGGDFLAFIDAEDGSARIPSITIDGIDSISDIYLKGSMLYILSDDKKMALYDMERQTGQVSMEPEAGKKRSVGMPERKHMLYIVWVKNLPNNFIKYYLKSAGSLAVLLLAVANFILYREGSKIYLAQYIGIFAALSNAVCIFATAVKNILDFGDCRSRIDNVLDVYNSIDAISSTILKSSVFIGVVVTLSMLLTGYWVASLLTGAFAGIAVYWTGLSSLKKLRDSINNMVFELLSLEADEYELFKMIRNKIREIKKTGIENIRIKADVKNGIDKKTIWQIRRWSNLRRKITGGQSVLRENGNGLDFVINLKNRDIRYSALSVIEDFICYIGNNVNLSSIVIETAEDKSEEGK